MIENKKGVISETCETPYLFWGFALGFLGAIGIGLIALAIWLLYLDMFIAAVLCLGIGVFFLVLVWCYVSKIWAKYEFLDAGIHIKYPFRSPKMVAWDTLQEVCICYDGVPRDGGRTQSVICFVKKGEKKNASMRWKTINPFHYRSIFCVDYNTKRYDIVKSVCPFEIQDIRKTHAYRLDMMR